MNTVFINYVEWIIFQSFYSIFCNCSSNNSLISPIANLSLDSWHHDLSIILVSHDLDLVAKYADKVVLLKGTVLCNGTPKEVFTNNITNKIFGLSWYEDDTKKNKGGKK